MKKLFFILNLFFCVGLFSQTLSFTYTGPSAITDNAASPGNRYPLTVNSGNQIMDASWGLQSVTVNITHLFVGDLYLYLVSPTGTIVDLCVVRGGAADHFTGTVFNSSSATPIATAPTPYLAGPYAPEMHLGNFNMGSTSTGIWYLGVWDVAAGIAGTLNSFTLTFSNTPATPQVWMGAGICTIYECTSFKFYDLGGPSANYPNNYTAGLNQTFCPENPNMCVSAQFNANTVFTGGCLADYLDIFNGTTVDYVTPGIYQGSFCNGTFGAINVVSTSADGCLTFRFRSNATGNASGWNADISCVAGCTPPSPPANDDCAGATTLTTIGGNQNAQGCDVAPIGNAISGAANCGWSSTDNSTFYTFDVTASTPQPVVIQLTSVSCVGGGNAAQVAIFNNDCATIGTYGSNYHGCASGTGSLNITASTNPLPIGTYILAVDGQAGASCNFTFNGSVVLPIHLKEFEVIKVNTNQASLSWTTLSEFNNSHFIIERSNDGKSFIEIGKVASSANLNGVKDEIKYEFIDLNPFSGINYYRIAQVDINGDINYYPYRYVDFSDEVVSFSTYPNPVTDQLIIELHSAKSYEAFLEIYDNKGQRVKQNILLVDKNSSVFTFDVKEFSEGIYFIKLITPTNILEKKTIIKK